MADLTPEQDKLNSAAGHAFLAAQMMRQYTDQLITTHIKGRAPSEPEMQVIEAEWATIAAYFALLRKEG